MLFLLAACIGATSLLPSTSLGLVVDFVALLGAIALLTLRSGPAVVAFCAAVIPTGLAARQFLAVHVAGGASIDPTLFLLILLACAALARPRLGEWRVFYLALGVAFAVGLATGLVKHNSAFEIARDISGMLPLVAFALAESSIGSAAAARKVIASSLAGLAVFSAAMLLLASFRFPAVDQLLQSYWHGRPRLYFHNSYLLPPFVGAALATCLTGRRKRLLFLVLAVCFLLAAVLSVTRQVVAWSCLAIVMALLVSLRTTIGGGVRNALASALLVTALLLSILVLTNSFPSTSSAMDGEGYVSRLVERTAALVEDLSDPTSGRAVSIQEAWGKDMEAFPLGDGLGTLFPNPWASTSYNEARTTGFQPVVDNLALTVLGKLGLLGLVAYGILFALFGRIAVRCWRALRSNPADVLVRFGLLLPLFATPLLLLLSFGQSFMFNSPITIAIAVLFGASSRLAADFRIPRRVKN